MRARTRNCLQCGNAQCATVHLHEGLSADAAEELADMLSRVLYFGADADTVQRELINFRNGLASQLTHWPEDNSDLLG